MLLIKYNKVLFTNRLKKLREEYNLSSKDIAQLLRIPEQKYNKYELEINNISLKN